MPKRQGGNKETPYGYTDMPKRQGGNKETPCGYTDMPKRQGKNWKGALNGKAGT